MGKGDNRELLRIAAEAGAKAALERMDKERAKAAEERIDQRLYNTRLLLKNYRLFKLHAQNAVYEADQLEESVFDILDMMDRSSSVGVVDSIKCSAARTAILVQHVEVMLELYQVYCERSAKPEDQRKWRVIRARHLESQEMSVLDIADQEHVSDRTVERDLSAAYEQLAALFFGIDGVKNRREKLCRKHVGDMTV